MAKPSNRAPKRKGHRGRFKRGSDAIVQLDEITAAQRAIRTGRRSGIIESYAKSEQRLANKLAAVKTADDAINEFD